MLAVCNGAPKSGSTWLFNIVFQIRPFDRPNRTYLTQTNSKHPTIRGRQLADFLDAGDYKNADIISKNHYSKVELRDLLLQYEDVKILCMSRDMRDVVVSSYYDSRRRDQFEGDFDGYYWRVMLRPRIPDTL